MEELTGNCPFIRKYALPGFRLTLHLDMVGFYLCLLYVKKLFCFTQGASVSDQEDDSRTTKDDPHRMLDINLDE